MLHAFQVLGVFWGIPGWSAQGYRAPHLLGRQGLGALTLYIGAFFKAFPFFLFLRMCFTFNSTPAGLYRGSLGLLLGVFGGYICCTAPRYPLRFVCCGVFATFYLYCVQLFLSR